MICRPFLFMVTEEKMEESDEHRATGGVCFFFFAEASQFDSHHSFIVRYTAAEDLGLDMHTDDSATGHEGWVIFGLRPIGGVKTGQSGDCSDCAGIIGVHGQTTKQRPLKEG